MLKKIIILGLCASMLLAIGEQPRTTDSPETPPASSGGSGYVPTPGKTPIEELSADALYRRAVSEHGVAQSMNYPEQTALAIDAEKLFIEKYPSDNRGFELMYYLTLDYAKNSDLEGRKATVERFFAQADPEDEGLKDLTALMRRELLPVLIYSGETASANELYAELQEQYVSDNARLASLYQDMLPLLDNESEKAVYIFFRTGDNQRYLRNPVNYYIYTYNLAVIYFDEENYDLAKPLFEEVVARKEPEYRFFVESASSYLER